MPDTGSETISLDLGGNFKQEAGANAAAAKTLISSFDALAAASKKVKPPNFDWAPAAEKSADAAKKTAAWSATQTSWMQKQISMHKEIAGFDAKRASRISAMEREYKRMNELATGSGGASGEGSMFGSGLMFSAGGTMLSAAGKMVGAAKDMLVASLEYGKAGYMKEVEESGKREHSTKGLGVLTGGHGNAAYNMAFDLAAKYNFNVDESVGKVKQLVNAGYSSREIPLAVRASVGMNEVKAGSGDDFLGKLEQAKLKGKVDNKFFKGLAKDGIELDAVYKEIARKTGESVDKIKEKAKKGTLDTKVSTDAALAVANRKFGALADDVGNSVPGLLNKIRLGFDKMFSVGDLAPVKSVLKDIGDALASPAGAEMAASFKELFSATNMALFGQFQGGKGKEVVVGFMHDVSAAVRSLAAAIREAAPQIQMLERMLMRNAVMAIKGAGAFLAKKHDDSLLKPGASNSAAGKWSGGHLGNGDTGGGAKLPNDSKGKSTLETAWDSIKKGMNGAWGDNAEANGPLEKLKGKAEDALPGQGLGGKLLGVPQVDDLGAANNNAVIPAANDNAAAIPGAVDTMGPGMSLGGDLAAGMAAGIAGGESQAIAAAVAMAENSLAAAKAKLGVHSPSTEFAEVGMFSAAGMAGGMTAHAGKVSAAGAGLGKSALSGAGGGAGGAGGAGGGGGGAPTINVMVNGPMKKGEAEELGKIIGDGAYQAWRKNERQFQRDKREGAAA